MFPKVFQSLSVIAWLQIPSAIRFVAIGICLGVFCSASPAAEDARKPSKQNGKAPTTTQPQRPRVKQVIGAVASVEEKQSDLVFTARVDTGATTSSIHVEEWKIAEQAKDMTKNLGKTIRFLIKNDQGKTKWLERKITEISVIKTSEREETRYKVPVTLICNGVKKRVLVSLNDRSHMKYPMLLGRNYLEGDFLVDVEIDE